MSWKDQARRRRQAMTRGRRRGRRVVRELLRRVFGPAARGADLVLVPDDADDHWADA